MSGRRVVPHPPKRIPFLGDLLTMRIPDTAMGAWNDADEFGPIYERKYGNLRVTYVSGASVVAAVNDEQHWEKFLGVPLKELRSIAGDGLFTAETSEPNWSLAHAILAPAFTAPAMRSYHGEIANTIETLVDYWGRRGSGTWLDIAADMNDYALEVIGRVAFGYDFESFGRAEPHVLVRSLLRSMKYVNRMAYSSPALEATVFRRQQTQHRRDVGTIRGFLDDIVSRRQAQSQAGTDSGRTDLLSLMLATAHPESGEALSEENIRNQILTFLLAGQETSAGALSFALHYLAQRPDVARRARSEIAQVCGESAIDFDSVAKLRYVRRVVDEVLRLWPVAPGYFRKAKHDTVVDGRHSFRAGEWVFVVLPKLHRDSAWGPHASEFDPDRWDRDRLPKNLALIYKPFGTGMRACIGRQFAYHEIVLTLATILRTFDLEPEPGYVLAVAESVSLKPDGLRIRMRPRQRANSE